MGVLKRLLKAAGTNQASVGTLNQGKSIADCKGIDPKVLEAIYALGHQHYQSEKFETARNIMLYLCVQDHRNPTYLSALGACEYRLKNYQAAELSLTEALGHNSTDPRTVLNLALSLLKGGKKREARRFMKQAEQLASGNQEFAMEWKLASQILERSGTNKNKTQEQ